MGELTGELTGSHLSSNWPWLRNVSTSNSLAKGDDYHFKGFL